ncbi:hypothetical protein LX15_002029 [Streptoalloteichus tenebrarius]|uniref:Secreted protein n=1 Tax=Streptoalloteichus tenebrarius (strain ATCC 17920 / DSM 40477 / JCM 4838 / CBS 697.72 / NBRC 16177 / NCIMB 11028 / NRRL B-12390 / A12253. 1 / ISP 5477) TaxID=1933 RepID=A0ABT1HSC8_STRSD|nr:hypothetical protein [Streptoalloteichus tenebrarius]MCP2258335.1 hypothetical protein [Streptoalloteichus tenebrarius]BFF03501.1 hypothetical protein GCM10020241_51760 [Streptoalloteichus tenebrarius]
MGLVSAVSWTALVVALSLSCVRGITVVVAMVVALRRTSPAQRPAILRALAELMRSHHRQRRAALRRRREPREEEGAETVHSGQE